MWRGRLHKMIRGDALAGAGRNKVRITPSVGVASYPVDSKTRKDCCIWRTKPCTWWKNTNRDSVAAANMGIFADTLANAESAS